MTWEIFLGLVALIGFIASVTGPMIKLTTSISKLNSNIETLQLALDRIDEANKEEHKKINEALTQHELIIENHENRLKNIEHTMDLVDNAHPEFSTFRVKD